MSTGSVRGLLAMASLAMVVAMSMAVPAVADDREPQIVVTGQGSAALAPDMAVLTLTVNRAAPTAREAVSANNQAMTGVLEAMRKLDIAGRDLQTAGFSIQPQYAPPQRGAVGEEAARKLTGYIVRNTLTVRVRDMERVGEVLDRAVSLGVNEGGDIALVNEDPSEALDKARKLAVQDASARARTLAEAAGVKLGGVLEISEHGYSSPRPMAMASRMAAEDAVPIASGENSYQVTVNMTFAIAD